MADGVPLHEPVEEIARRLPYKLACAGGTGSLRYGELADAADRLAARLVAAGVGRDDRVGLFLARGPDLAVGILGVLRAGAAYLPLGIADPPARVAAVIADAAPRCVLVHGPTSARFTGDTMVLDLDASTEEPSEAEPVEDSAAAYVVYTSGSTGARAAWSSSTATSPGTSPGCARSSRSRPANGCSSWLPSPSTRP